MVAWPHVRIDLKAKPHERVGGREETGPDVLVRHATTSNLNFSGSLANANEPHETPDPHTASNRAATPDHPQHPHAHPAILPHGVPDSDARFRYAFAVASQR